MPATLFLAMTAAEIDRKIPINAGKAWMACHFSPYGTGLSNFPQSLPPGSMLIVNDRTPVHGHDPALIAQQLSDMVQALGCSRVLLDFQRPDEPQTAEIAAAIVAKLPCPVGVSHCYATNLDCPVFLPPQPLHIPLCKPLLPFHGRKIWLEAAPETAVYTVTKDGCSIHAAPDNGEYPHTDKALFCHYRIDTEENAVRFTLHRGWDELRAMMEAAENVDCFVGLYQEFAQPVAQDTAFFQ